MASFSKRRLLIALSRPVVLRSFSAYVLCVICIHWLRWWPQTLLAWCCCVAAYAVYYLTCCVGQIVIPGRPDVNSTAPGPDGSTTGERLMRAMPCLQRRGYWPTPFMINSHIATLYGGSRPAPRSFRVDREIAHGVLHDGELCVLDWVRPDPVAAARAEAEWARDCFYSFDSPAAYLDHTLDFRRHQEMRRIISGAYEAPSGGAAPASPTGGPASVAPPAGPTPVLAPTKLPVVLLFPGLTSGSDDGNACCLAQAIAAQGWHVVMPIRRGCCDDPNLTTKGKYYAYGGLEDSTHVVEHVARTMPGHPLFAVGLSAGSNVAVNYVASAGRFSQVLGCVSVANGFCWQRGTRALARYHPVWDVVMTTMVRARLFTRFKKNIVARQRHTFSDAPPGVDEHGASGRPDRVRPTARQRSDVPEDEPEPMTSGVTSEASDEEEEEVLGYGSARWRRRHLRTMLGDMLKSEAATIRKHDELITRRLHGFTSLEEFYAEQGCVHRLHRVKVPTVFMNALNDPVAAGDNVPVAALRRHAHALTVLTYRGGHLGYPESLNPFYGERRSYLDRFVIDALRAVMQEAKLRMRHPEVAAPVAGEVVPVPRDAAVAASPHNGNVVTPVVPAFGTSGGAPCALSVPVAAGLPGSPTAAISELLMKGARRSSGWVAATPTMAVTSATVVAPLTRTQSRADFAIFGQ